jgi:hypothetical protein
MNQEGIIFALREWFRKLPKPGWGLGLLQLPLLALGFAGWWYSTEIPPSEAIGFNYMGIAVGSVLLWIIPRDRLKIIRGVLFTLLLIANVYGIAMSFVNIGAFADHPIGAFFSLLVLLASVWIYIT